MAGPAQGPRGRACPGLPSPRPWRRGGGRHAFSTRRPPALARRLSRARVLARGRRHHRPRDARPPPRCRGLRERGHGSGSRAVEPARRHRGRVLADARATGAGGVLRRRGRVPAPLRSDDPALGRGPHRAHGAPAERRWGYLGFPARLAPLRHPRDARRSGPARRPARGRAVRSAPRRGSGRIPAARAAAPSARQWPCAARLHGHAFGRRVSGALQGVGRDDPRVAERGLRRASRGGRRSAGGEAPGYPQRARPRAVARRLSMERRGARGHHGRLRRGIPVARSRSGRPRRGGYLRGAPPPSPAPRLPARSGHRRLHRPQAQ